MNETLNDANTRPDQAKERPVAGHDRGRNASSVSSTSQTRGRRADVLSYVRDLTRRSRSSFYYSFLLLPRPKRHAIYAVYALSRAVDDAVDESSSPEAARARLSFWKEETARLAEGRPQHPITQAVARAREMFPIPLEAIDALLEGARMDLERRRYRSFAELKVYCERVASAVGRMCLEIFGYTSPSALDYAHDLGLALQLTNILRDVGSDARRGRLYLPQEDLESFHVSEEDLLAGRRTPEVLALLAFEAERAKTYYRSAGASLDARDRGTLLAAEVMRAIYARLLSRIERSGFDVFATRQSLSRLQKARIALMVLARTRLFPASTS